MCSIQTDDTFFFIVDIIFLFFMQCLCRLYLHGLPCRIPNAHHHHQRYQQPSPQRAYQEAHHAPLHGPSGNQCSTSNGEFADTYVVTYQHGRQSNQRQQQ